MITIHKYSLYSETSLTLKNGAEILTAKLQNNTPQLWVKLDTERLDETRDFIVVPTGCDIKAEKTSYISTLFFDDGLVFHVFEVL